MAQMQVSNVPLLELSTGGFVPQAVAVYDQPLFDTQDFPAAGGAVERSYFTDPTTYASGAAKNPVDSNMPNSGMLPSPQTFTADGISINFLAGLGSSGVRPTATAMNSFRMNAHLEIHQGENTIQRVPIENFSGPGFNIAASTGVVGPYLNQGTAAGVDHWYFGFSFARQPGQRFAIILVTSPDYDPNDYAMRVRVSLHGLLTKALG